MPDPSLDRNQSDLILIEGLKEGKRECYEALYNRYLETIYRFIFYMIHQKEAAEDLTQEVFIKLYHSAHLFDLKRGTFSAWLHQMAKNLTLDYLRHEKTQAAESISHSQSSSEDLMQIEHILRDQRILPDEAAVTQEQLELFEKALLELSERGRQLIILCTINEFSHSEVAQILNCSVTSVKVGLHRARERLLKQMGIPKELGAL